MKLENTDLIARLADEYVLGTLRGRARRRFERLVALRETARSSVNRAEDRMLPLSLALPPIQPAQASWDAIAAQLGVASRRAESPRATTRPWRLALAAAVALLAIGLAWLVIPRPAQPTAVASVTSEGGAPLWSVATYAKGPELRVRVTGAVTVQPGRDYELWALPEGGAPVSLGLMPESGEAERELSAAQRTALSSASKVAVSLEPVGGSTTGAPTGPVLYVAVLRRG
jgi:anti-sigma-K factor RskA